MVAPREEFLGAITLLDENGTGTVDANGANLTNTGYLVLNEKSGAPATGASKGSFWVSNDSPTLPKFTDSAGTTITLGAGGGAVTPPLDVVLGVGNETGANWIEINNGYGLRGQAVGSSFSIQTLDALSGTTGSIEIKTGTQGNPANSSGAIDILTRSTAGYSGDITIKSEASGKSSGDIEISTDISGSGSEGSGSIAVSTGGAGGADAGDLTLSTGGNGTGHGGDISISTGPGGGDRAGHFSLVTGSGASGGQGGNIDMLTGSGASSNPAGDITLTTGAAGPSSSAGNIVLKTGDSVVGTGGDIIIETGSATAAGDIYLTAGRSTSQDGGDIKLTGGRGDSTNGGNVILYGGRPDISGDRGEVLFGTTDDSGPEYTIARVVDRGPGPPNQTGRAFRFDYFYSLDVSIAVDDADGVSGNAATNLNIWGSNSYNETIDPGEKGGDIILTAGAGGDSVSSGGGLGGDIILRAGSRGTGGGGNGYVGYIEIDNILRMDSIGATPLWTPGANTFIMFNLGGIPKVRPASSTTNYNVALVLQATLNHDFGEIAANNYLETGLTVTGAEVGDHAIVNAPDLEAGLIATAFVGAANTAVIRVNNTTSAPIDPAAQDFLVTVIKA